MKDFKKLIQHLIIKLSKIKFCKNIFMTIAYIIKSKKMFGFAARRRLTAHDLARTSPLLSGLWTMEFSYWLIIQ